MENFIEEIVDDVEILKNADEIKVLIKEDRYNNDSLKDLRKEYPDKSAKLEETLLN